MSKVTLAQFSFNRGEIDPALHARSDWKYYYAGAKTLRNLIPRPQGGAVKRGGLRLVAPALSDSKPSYLVPFRFSVRQSYMLELGDRTMRIIRDGGLVVYPAGHARAGEVVAIDTPYPVEAVPRLRHAQTADVMIFTHADYPPQRLSRHDHHDWRFENLVTNSRTATPRNLRVTESGGDGARYVVTALSATDGESPPSEAVTAANSGAIEAPDGDLAFSELYQWLLDHDYSYTPTDVKFHGWLPDRFVEFLGDCGYTDISGWDNSYRYRYRDPDGVIDTVTWADGEYSNLITEALRACDRGWAGNVKPGLTAQIAVYVRDYNAGLSMTRVTELAWDAVPGAASYRVYRVTSAGDAGGYCYIGETASAAFVDRNLPAQATGLPEEVELFTGLDDYPGVCAFFEQRLILARSNNQPTTFWGSDTGLYNSFTRHTPVEDADCYEFTLASGEMNEIHWIVPLNDMLLGSSGGEWKAGGGGGAITPTNVNARVQSWYGCSSLPPVVVGRTVIFTGRSRRTIRNFAYSLEADGYSGRDLTVYASHLFAGREAVGMCHQQEPSGILWVVLSDGGLASCTYAPEEDVVAWARHETRGRFESVGSLVDTDGTDQVYFCVAREIAGVTRRFIETLEEAADAVTDETDGFFLDCGLTYRGTPVSSCQGLGHLNGERVSVLADGCVFTELPVANGRVTLPGGFTASVIHAGLPYRSELVTLDLEPEDKETIRNRCRFAVSASVLLDRSRDCRYSHSGGALMEMKFRTNEDPGRAIRLFTGEKNVVFASPPGARSASLRFVSDAPAPFSLLGLVVEASYGQPA